MRQSFQIAILVGVLLIGVGAGSLQQAQTSANLAALTSRVDENKVILTALTDHTSNRRRALLKTFRAISGKPFILLLGDSISEDSDLPETVCGVELINAGISGERVSSFIPFVEDIVSRARPTVTIVALGINDTHERYWTAQKLQQFKAAYSMLLAMLPSDTLIASLTSFDRSKIVGKEISPEGWGAINGAILEIANERNTAVINLGPTEIASSTRDGLHPDHISYPAWRSKILGAIKAKLGC